MHSFFGSGRLQSDYHAIDKIERCFFPLTNHPWCVEIIGLLSRVYLSSLMLKDLFNNARFTFKPNRGLEDSEPKVRIWKCLQLVMSRTNCTRIPSMQIYRKPVFDDPRAYGQSIAIFKKICFKIVVYICLLCSN